MMPLTRRPGGGQLALTVPWSWVTAGAVIRAGSGAGLRAGAADVRVLPDRVMSPAWVAGGGAGAVPGGVLVGVPCPEASAGIADRESRPLRSITSKERCAAARVERCGG